MGAPPENVAEPKSLKFLRRLVTVLTLTMIIGLVTLIGLFVMRFSDHFRSVPALTVDVKLPDGSRPVAYTKGSDWYAIVTDADQILIFDLQTNKLRQQINVLPKQ